MGPKSLISKEKSAYFDYEVTDSGQIKAMFTGRQ